MLKHVLGLAGMVLLVVCPARADIDLTQYLQNAGFEASTSFAYSCSAPLCSPAQYWNDSAPDWTLVGPGGVATNVGGDYRPQEGTSSDPGAFDPGYTSSNGDNAFINPVSGFNVGWLQPGAFMYQTIQGLTFSPGTIYVVPYYVGRRLEQDSSNFQITATVGATTPGSTFIESGLDENTWRLFGNTSDITPGTWQLNTLTFSSDDQALQGDQITIWLGAEGAPGSGNSMQVLGTGQVDFDVPEADSLTLLITLLTAGGLALRLRRRFA